MFRPLLAALALVLALAPDFAAGQGVLVNVDSGQSVRLPRLATGATPAPGSYKIKELAVQAQLEDQVARVQVSQTFLNTGSQQMEVAFVFPLPYDGAVDRLTLLVDGKEYPARLLEAKEARETYESIVRKNRDPALLEWMGRGMFQTSVFPVPAGAERKVTLRYNQLLRNFSGLTDFLFPLSTAKFTSHPLESLSFQVTIASRAPIKNVYSPTHTVEVKRPDEQHATVSYQSKGDVPTTDFRVFYDVGQEPLEAKLLTYRPESDERGYFLLLATPKIENKPAEQTKKNVVFVVDRSGSMSGEKIEQAKGAVKFVLNNLREGDLFNVVAYDDAVESFRPELQRFDDETRKAALGFVEGLFAGGSTNIEAALASALDQLQDESRPSYVIFLTDGLPTAGVTNEAQIVESAKQHNDVRARLFVFGVGYDVNSRLLDRLARQGHGLSEYVRPNEDIEGHVSRLYSRISAPVLTGATFAIEFDGAEPEAGPPVSQVYPDGEFDLFAGEQLVIVGRYQRAGAAKVVVRGKLGGEEREFSFPAEFAEKSGDQSLAFVETLWAGRRIGEILDQLDLHGKNEELVAELVELSTRHGILTPYTSFLADENTNLHDLAANAARTNRALREFEITEGVSGVAQRRAKANYRRAENIAQLYGEPIRGDADPAARPGLRQPGAPTAASGYGGLPDVAAPRSRPVANAPTAGATPAQVIDTATDQVVAVGGVMRVAGKTFYQRGGRWIDGSANEKQQQRPQKLERFSKEYFALAERHPEAAQYLAIEEPVVVVIGGTAYELGPAEHRS